MIDEFESLGSVPVEEDCAQVGSMNYDKISKIECYVFADQIKRAFKEQLETTPITIETKQFDHDFGHYCEVCAIFNSEDEAQTNLAFLMSDNIPMKWDTDAKHKLYEMLKAVGVNEYLGQKI